MEIIVQEKGAEHLTTVVKDGDRMAVLITNGSRLEHAETVGCFDAAEAQLFAEEALAWLVTYGHVPSERRSGEYAAIRLDAALQRATG